MSDVTFPEVFQAELSEAEVRALFADLAACAEVLDVFAKGGPEARAVELGGSIAVALEALLSRGVRAVQVRYRHDGGEWRDTITAGADAYRLVRVRTPAAPA